MDTEKIKEELYDYLEPNYVITVMNPSYYSKLKIMARKKSEPGSPQYSMSKSEYMKMAAESTFLPISLPDAVKVDFFVYLYKKYKDMSLYRQVGYVCPKTAHKFYENILNPAANIEVALSHISATELPVDKLDLQKFDDFLTTKKIANVDRLYQNFFQKRKTAMSHHMTGPVIRDFLVSKFGRDNLKFYVPLSIYVRDLFEQRPLECFEKNKEYELSVQINPQKLIANLAADSMASFTVLPTLKQLAAVWPQMLAGESPRIKGSIELRFFSESPIDRAEIVADIENFFYFLKDTKSQYHTPENIKSWFEKRQLQRQVTTSTTRKSFKL